MKSLKERFLKLNKKLSREMAEKGIKRKDVEEAIAQIREQST